MKRVICLLLVLCLVVPAIAQLTPEEQSEFLRKQYLDCMNENLELRLALNKAKDSDRDSSLIAGYVIGGLGVWGIVSFASTGGLYQLVTGCLFVTASYRALKESTRKK